jgi:hypothetical protein
LRNGIQPVYSRSGGDYGIDLLDPWHIDLLDGIILPVFPEFFTPFLLIENFFLNT